MVPRGTSSGQELHESGRESQASAPAGRHRNRPRSIRVRTFRNPFCLKWRSDSQDAKDDQEEGET